MPEYQTMADQMAAQYQYAPDATYGDQYAQQTSNRAAYGDIASGLMMGGRTTATGMYGGATRMFQDIGARIIPTHYTPPARVATGYYGQYAQQTGFLAGGLATLGMGAVPRGTTAYEHYTLSSGDFGERMGSGLASAGLTVGANALAMTAGAVLGGAAGGAIGGFVGSALGPIGTIAGAGIGRFVGSTFAPYIGASMANTAVLDAVSQRRDIQNGLEASSFRFVTTGNAITDPRGVGGMSRTARQDVTNFIRKMDVEDPLMDTKDLTQILSKGTDLGLFAGSSSMNDFKKKFKDITESVKTVVSTLHTTLEEGLRVIKDLKGIGVDPSMVKQVVQSADAMGRMAGRTGQEMIGIGLQGAEIFRGTGVTMGLGFQSNMMNMAAIRATRDAGTLSQEAIMQAGGEEALAQRMTANSLAFSQTMAGRGIGGAFYNQSLTGSGAGGFNATAFTQAAMGGKDFPGLFMQAAGNLGNPAALRTYMANQEKFTSEMGSAMGGQGLKFNQMLFATSQAQFIAKATGASVETEFVNALKEQGVARPDIDAMLAQVKSRKDGFNSAQEAARQTSVKMVTEEAAQNFIFNRIGGRVKDVLTGAKDVLARPIDELINKTADVTQRVTDYSLGITRFNVSGADLTGASLGGRVASREVPDLSKADLTAFDPSGTSTATPSVMRADLESTIPTEVKRALGMDTAVDPSSRMPTGLKAEILKTAGGDVTKPLSQEDMLRQVDLTQGAVGTLMHGSKAQVLQTAIDAGALEGLGIDLTKKTGAKVGTVSVKSERTDAFGGMASVDARLSQVDLDKLVDRAAVLQISPDKAEKLAKAEDVEKSQANLAKAMRSKDLSSKVVNGRMVTPNANDVALAVVGKPLGQLNASEFASMQIAVKGTEFAQTVEKGRKAGLDAAGIMEAVDTAQMVNAQKIFEASKKDIEGVTGELPFGVAEKLARAKLASTPEERTKLKSEAVLTLARSTGDVEKANRIMDRAENITDDQAKKMNDAVNNIARTQSFVGSEKLASTLLQSTVGITGENAPTALEAVQTVRTKGVFALTAKQIASFKGTETEGMLAGVQQAGTKLSKDLERGNESDARAIINEQLQDPKQQKLAMDEFNQGHVDTVKQMFSDQLSQKMAGTSGASLEGKQVAPLGSQATAAQNETTQMQINLTTLAIMDGLAKRLGVK